jgi:hypothetical protein
MREAFRADHSKERFLADPQAVGGFGGCKALGHWFEINSVQVFNQGENPKSPSRILSAL